MTAAEALETARCQGGVRACIWRTFDIEPIYFVGPRAGKVAGYGLSWRMAMLRADVRPEDFRMRRERAA